MEQSITVTALVADNNEGVEMMDTTTGTTEELPVIVQGLPTSVNNNSESEEMPNDSTDETSSDSIEEMPVNVVAYSITNEELAVAGSSKTSSAEKPTYSTVSMLNMTKQPITITIEDSDEDNEPDLAIPGTSEAITIDDSDDEDIINQPLRRQIAANITESPIIVIEEGSDDEIEITVITKRIKKLTTIELAREVHRHYKTYHKLHETVRDLKRKSEFGTANLSRAIRQSECSMKFACYRFNDIIEQSVVDDFDFEVFLEELIDDIPASVLCHLRAITFMLLYVIPRSEFAITFWSEPPIYFLVERRKGTTTETDIATFKADVAEFLRLHPDF